MKRQFLLLFLFLMLLNLTACGGGGGGSTGSAPVAPSGLSAIATSESSIDLNWTDNSSDETNFVVQRSDTSGSGFSTIATLAANITSYSDTAGLSAGTTYYYRVHATNSTGSSSNSNEISATTTAAPTTVPAAPSGLSATATSEINIDLSWSDNSTDESNFVVQRSATSGTGFATIDTLAANTTSYSNSGLTGSTTYYYRVYATNSVGDSGFSNEVNATTPAAATPFPAANIPFSAGKKWLYNFDRTLTWVATCCGVNTTIFNGEALLYVVGQTIWQGRQAWQVTRYELESSPAGDNAFGVKVEYLFQDTNGLEKWHSGSSTWKRILSTQVDSFGSNSLLFTREPNSSSLTTLTYPSVTVPAGTYTTARANAYYKTGFSQYAPVDHEENHYEYYADNVGLIKSTWDFWYDDNDPDATDVYEDGIAELTGIDTGPTVNPESEANDSAATAQTIAGNNSIVSGKVKIGDPGDVVTDINVNANISGEQKLEDWYTFQRTVSGSFRLDMRYADYYIQTGTNPNTYEYQDLDVYLFREETNGTLTFISKSTNDPRNDADREGMVEASLPAGTYHVAIQAWDTQTDDVDYWFVIR